MVKSMQINTKMVKKSQCLNTTTASKEARTEKRSPTVQLSKKEEF